MNKIYEVYISGYYGETFLSDNSSTGTNNYKNCTVIKKLHHNVAKNGQQRHCT